MFRAERLAFLSALLGTLLLFLKIVFEAFPQSKLELNSLFEYLASVSPSKNYLAVFVFGAGIGTAELVARYKDAPLQALATRPAMLYVAVNAFAGPLALYLVQRFGVLDTVPEATREISRIMLAGTGAMAFFRSSVFTVRVGNSEVGVGPAGLLQVILTAADRATDRDRAGPRARSVAEIMNTVSFDKARQALPTICFALMQNVSADEVKAFGNLAKDIESSQMDDTFKAYNLGLNLMNLVGENVLREAVSMLRSGIVLPPQPVVTSFETLSLLRKVDFHRHGMSIIKICLIVTGQLKRRPLERSLRRFWSEDKGQDNSVLKQWNDRIEEIKNINASDPMFLLVADLLNEFHEDTVLMALQSVIADKQEERAEDATDDEPENPVKSGSGSEKKRLQGALV